MRANDSKKRNPYKPKRDAKAYVKFLAIALMMLFLMDHWLWQGERPYITKMKAEYYAEQAEKEALEKAALEYLLPPKIVFPETGEPYFESPVGEVVEEGAEEESISKITKEEDFEIDSLIIEKEIIKKEKITKKQPRPKTIKPFTGARAKIAIVIDDVGMNLSQSRAAINLDSNVTLAFLPYATRVKALAAQGKSKGHEIIIHTPMEAINGRMNLGPLALKANMASTDFTAEFQKITESFEGYVGINNHMGSRLTQDKKAMGQLMRLLKSKKLYFLDSKTINTSIAAQTAAFYGVPFAVRDVFLDHEDTPEFVAKALRRTERVARETGRAIAIGHPKKNTMAALQKWLPTLDAKGFDLVPLSALIQTGAPVPIIQMVKEEPKEKKSSSSVSAPKILNFQLPE
jgi:polysaccharide deacetylase 2 family uncharacterized protein YibQ